MKKAFIQFMKLNKVFIGISLLIIPVLFGIFFADLSGIFDYTDTPFGLAFLLYGVFIQIQREKSRITFVFALFFLILMGLSYVPTGAGKITERMGEWFYLFFVFGLVQYVREAKT